MDLDYLNQQIDESGIKQTFLAQKLGLRRQGFYQKKKGIAKFSFDEVMVLAKYVPLDLNRLHGEEVVVLSKEDVPKEEPKAPSPAVSFDKAPDREGEAVYVVKSDHTIEKDVILRIEKSESSRGRLFMGRTGVYFEADFGYDVFVSREAAESFARKR